MYGLVWEETYGKFSLFGLTMINRLVGKTTYGKIRIDPCGSGGKLFGNLNNRIVS
jgi:hypothetical protein